MSSPKLKKENTMQLHHLSWRHEGNTNNDERTTPVTQGWFPLFTFGSHVYAWNNICRYLFQMFLLQKHRHLRTYSCNTQCSNHVYIYTVLNPFHHHAYYRLLPLMSHHHVHGIPLNCFFVTSTSCCCTFVCFNSMNLSGVLMVAQKSWILWQQIKGYINKHAYILEQHQNPTGNVLKRKQGIRINKDHKYRYIIKYSKHLAQSST